MEKPQSYEPKKVINLIKVLEYVNELVPGSHRKIWNQLKTMKIMLHIGVTEK